MSRLTNPLKLRELAEGGVIFQVDANNVAENDSDSDEESQAAILDEKLKQANKECIGVFDEDTYEESEPFERIARKMTNLTPDGKIKKRILREGEGDHPEEYGSVKINYNAYLEYDEMPFDSTYVRNKAHKFIIGGGKMLAGLDFAVRTMLLNEKSQFLIHPDYAYGKHCFGKVPSNATILFEVELIEVVNSGAAVTFEKLSEEEQRTFPEVYKYCLALCERGKQAFGEHNLKNAIKDYNTAVCKLERVVLGGTEEVEKHRELSLKLYSNLLICYARSHEPRKGCHNAKKIYSMTEDGELMKIPAKVYFNHARCLRILAEYDSAEDVLEKARKLEPKNADIANEILILKQEMKNHKKAELVFAQALIGK